VAGGCHLAHCLLSKAVGCYTDSWIDAYSSVTAGAMEGTDVDGAADCGLYSTSVAVAVGVVEAADLAEDAGSGDNHLLLLEVEDYL